MASAYDLRLLSLPTRDQLGSAHDASPESNRQIVVLRLEQPDGAVGWGECAALNRPTYTSEWAEGSFDVLQAALDPDQAPALAEHPMARACLEMVALDATLRREGVSLTSQLGPSAERVRAGATIGLMPVEDSVAAVQALVDQGYQRVKVKVDPTQVDEVPHELSHAFDELEIHVDANGSLDERHMMALYSLANHGVSVIEQPFAVDRPDLAIELISVGVPMLLADEAAATLPDLMALVEQGACMGVSIKPPRVGGIGAAIEMLEWCRQVRFPAAVGGMLETGLGRHALAAFAAMSGISITGDLSPARRWLAADPWPDLEMVDGEIIVPTTPGIAPEPDQTVLDEFTIKRSTGTF